MSGFQYAPLLWPTLGSAVFLAGVTAYLWHKREMKGARTLALLGLLLMLWCLGAAAEVATKDVDVQRAWFLFRDALSLPAVILALVFTLQYAGLERWLTRPVAALLVGILVVHTALYAVDGGRLLWADVWWEGEIRGDRAPLGIAFGALSFVLFLLGTAVYLLLFARSPAHRVPVALILLGQLTLRILYPLSVFSVVYVPNIQASVLAFDIVAVTYVVALVRFRLFDLVPVARDMILARMPDALLVVNPQDRVADLNNAALALLGLDRRAAIGQPVETAFSGLPNLARCIVAGGQAPEGLSSETVDGTRSFEVSTTPLVEWQSRPIGRLVLVHEISALRRVEARLVERERALAAAEERERLARELHDGLSQDLWLAKLSAGRLAALPGLGRDVRALTEELTAAVDAGLVEARHAVAAMRLPGDGRGTSLRELLTRSLEDFEDRSGLRVELEAVGDLPDLRARDEVETLRIVQEALTNVRRHADATVVRVRAEVDDGRLVVVVADNGRGFDPASLGPSTYGLAGMRERATLIGGELRIEAAPREGTRVHLVLPLAGEASVPVEVGAG